MPSTMNSTCFCTNDDAPALRIINKPMPDRNAVVAITTQSTCSSGESGRTPAVRARLLPSCSVMAMRISPKRYAY